MTLSQAALPGRSLTRNVMLVLAGTMLLALSAQASVPMFPVPMTLQTLAISLIGLTYGSRLAAVTLIAYLAEGAVGLPVFSNGGGGLPYMMGPTTGFLIGFVGMAWLTGWLVERGFDRGFGKLFLAAFIPALLLFVPGVLGLKLVTGMGWQAAVMAGAVPFLIGAVVKAVIAAMAVKGGWALFNRR
ncbi:biotin transporter BioY [Paracoccus sp. SCSIO 75233]|uniref:biotin transporter BioY n=1 Tax=Paracoccus sp. SCSIO 75233 TaxID=3017782 RepID=UPI0022F03D54|nr:biotin transporter BioY [Paracoccus sp. SCSIO 75233]WBU52140.1 biotin transporter BioY [Paracoccus sp. SCSIO 75233]